jgi:hypothetical protein
MNFIDWKSKVENCLLDKNNMQNIDLCAFWERNLDPETVSNIINNNINYDYYNEKFSTWKKKVDDAVFSKIKIHCIDLPDKDYWNFWYNNIASDNMSELVLNQFNKN